MRRLLDTHHQPVHRIGTTTERKLHSLAGIHVQVEICSSHHCLVCNFDQITKKHQIFHKETNSLKEMGAQETVPTSKERVTRENKM